MCTTGQLTRLALDGHLIAARHDGREQRYPLDAAGHHLADSGRDRHDGAGNLIERHDDSGHRLQLGYDAANRLVRLTRTDPRGRLTRADYRYDPLRRRIRKSVHDPEGNARTTHYGWDGDRMVHAAPDAGSAITLVYEPGSAVPLLRLDGHDRRPGLYLNDPLGTPLRLLAPDGRVRWRAQPDDWAAVRDEVGETQPIRFQGQWHDEESGLYYNRHRYYDPQAGRYISQDPIGLMGGLNLYGYAAAPVSMVDPMGLSGVYGLGNGPYSQSNMVRKAAEKTVTTGELNASAEAFGGVFGQTVSSGLKIDSQGNYAWTITECQRYGLGVFEAVGSTYAISISESPLKEGTTETWGAFGNGGLFGSAGISIDFGGGVGVARGFKGLGFGMAGGIQNCKTKTSILGAIAND